AGTRDRKPTGMAEVSLTLIDPQVYDGQPVGEPEIDIQDEMPLSMSEDDWDEASLRAVAAEATEAHVAEVQPGPLDWKEPLEGEAAPAEGATAGAASITPEGEQSQGSSVDSDSTAADQALERKTSQTPTLESQLAPQEPDAQAAHNGTNPVVLKIRRR